MILAAATSTWTVSDKSDAFSDQQFVTLITEQEENLLVLKCAKGDESWFLTIVTPVYIGGNPMMRTALLRVDSLSPTSETLVVTKGHVADALSPQYPIKAIIAAKTRVAFRIDKSRSDGGTTDIIFDAKGLPVKSAEFRKKCASLGVMVAN